MFGLSQSAMEFFPHLPESKRVLQYYPPALIRLRFEFSAGYSCVHRLIPIHAAKAWQKTAYLNERWVLAICA